MKSKDELKTPLDMFYHWESLKPSAVYLRQPIDQQWTEVTWRQVGDEARRIGNALKSFQLKGGERVCILSKNCAHWVIADLAIMMGGLSSAPAFTTMTAKDVLYILNHSQSKVLFVGATDNWASVKSILPNDVKVISLPGVDVAGADHRWEDLVSDYEPLPGKPSRNLEDEITTIYTSGSTGLPKGVVYSFRGAAHITRNMSQTFRMKESDRFISYLPMAHGFERAVVGLLSMSAGCSIGFNENQTSFGADMKAVEPTVFQCVPRLWTKFQQSIVTSFGGQDALDALLFDPEKAPVTKAGIRQALGLNEARIMLTGSGPTPMPLHAWYDAVDMPLCEIYGQSEVLSGTCNLPWDRKPGTLGKTMANTEIEIAGDGEILIKADAIMVGYLNEPEKTGEVMVGGWIHTGDKGEIDSDGYLKITGRVKEIYKTTKGKYVAPVPIEGLFVSNPYLDQVCLMGHGLPQTLLLVQLSDEGKREDAEIVKEKTLQQIRTINTEIQSHERIAGVVVVNDEWTSGNGLATHTLKIKRRSIEERYRSLVEEVFESGASISEPVFICEKIASR